MIIFGLLTQNLYILKIKLTKFIHKESEIRGYRQHGIAFSSRSNSRSIYQIISTCFNKM